MSEHQKMAILSNVLVRRLSNIHRDVVAVEMLEVIEHYVCQLKTSGFSRKQAREIVVCGIVGWRRKLERRENQGQHLVQGKQQKEIGKQEQQISIQPTIKEEKEGTATSNSRQEWNRHEGEGCDVCTLHCPLRQ